MGASAQGSSLTANKRQAQQKHCLSRLPASQSAADRHSGHTCCRFPVLGCPGHWQGIPAEENGSRCSCCLRHLAHLKSWLGWQVAPEPVGSCCCQRGWWCHWPTAAAGKGKLGKGPYVNQGYLCTKLSRMQQTRGGGGGGGGGHARAGLPRQASAPCAVQAAVLVQSKYWHCRPLPSCSSQGRLGTTPEDPGHPHTSGNWLMGIVATAGTY